LRNQGKSTIICPMKTYKIQYKPSNFDGIVISHIKLTEKLKLN